MNYKFFFVLYLFMSGVGLAANRFNSGTVVGNGGDPIFEFFEASRASLIESLKVVLYDPKEQENFCQLEALSSAQIVFCRDFFFAAIPQILKLSQGPNRTLFVLRENPLTVIGPDQKPMMVAARTELGPIGPIELHRDSVKTLVPTQALFLIAHEFLHKSSFEGIYVADNDPIGPFDYGRDLLDSAAKYLVALAVRTGRVGTQFGVQDIFKCEVHVGSATVGVAVSSNRMYLTKDLSSYESGIGMPPTETVYVPETENSSIALRVRITEPNNCNEQSSGRKTSLKILRNTTLSDRSTQADVLKEIELTENPMCPKANPNFEISWEQIKFSCKYFGSLGTTKSPFSLKSLGFRIPRPLYP